MSSNEFPEQQEKNGLGFDESQAVIVPQETKIKETHYGDKPTSELLFGEKAAMRWVGIRRVWRGKSFKFKLVIVVSILCVASYVGAAFWFGEPAPAKLLKIIYPDKPASKVTKIRHGGNTTIFKAPVDRTPAAAISWNVDSSDGTSAVVSAEQELVATVSGYSDVPEVEELKHSCDGKYLEDIDANQEQSQIRFLPSSGFWCPGRHILTAQIKVGNDHIEVRKDFDVEWNIKCDHLDLTKLISILDPSMFRGNVFCNSNEGCVVLNPATPDSNNPAYIRTQAVLASPRPLSIGVKVCLQRVRGGCFQIVTPFGISVLLNDGRFGQFTVKREDSYIDNRGQDTQKLRNAFKGHLPLVADEYVWIWVSFGSNEVVISQGVTATDTVFRLRCTPAPTFKDYALQLRSYIASAKISEIRICPFIEELNHPRTP